MWKHWWLTFCTWIWIWFWPLMEKAALTSTEGRVIQEPGFHFWMEAVEWEWYAGKRMKRRQRVRERQTDGGTIMPPILPRHSSCWCWGESVIPSATKGACQPLPVSRARIRRADTAGWRPILLGSSTAAATAPFRKPSVATLSWSVAKLCPQGSYYGDESWRRKGESTIGDSW